jgi:hypothetical protein
MGRRILSIALASVTALTFASTVWGQNTTVTQKEVIQHPDGSYSVIEYPVGKEVRVNLMPSATVKAGKGWATVMRSADGTKVSFNISGAPADASSYYAYAVDPTGTPTLLGPVTFTNGTGTAEFTTPMDQFMLVLSPTEGLTTYDTSTTYAFRSDVPKGYVVVPRHVSKSGVVAVSGTPGAYTVPLLNVPTWGDKEREVKLKFDGELQGLTAKAYITPKKGATRVRMHFDDMKKVPANKRFTLWAYSPDGTYTKLGQVINGGGRNESEIKTETALNDFGLFVTEDDTDVTTPTSTVYSVFTVPSS